MFPDDPDEDASQLDDDALLQAYLCPDGRSAAEQTDQPMPDWPPLRRQDATYDIDTAVLDWFRAHHADWRREIRLVLKAWVAAQTLGSTPPNAGPPPGTA